MAGRVRDRQPRPARMRPLFVSFAGLVLALGFGSTVPRPATAASVWDGSLDLYRSGTFTTQKTWLWCTAADVQIMRNIVDGQRDHAKASQQRYFEWMRSQNRYDLPLSAGVDPAGWTAGLRHFVDDRYRLVSSRSFGSALRSAVQRMRATNLPVALAVQHGNHGWVMTGFSATADPATTKDFTVTSVRVVGPLWGLQNRTYGYDMRPGRSLTVKQLRAFFTPWWYAPTRMIWDGRYVSIQPVPVRTATPQIAQAPAPVLPSMAPGASADATASTSAPTPATTPSSTAMAAAAADPSPATAADPSPAPAGADAIATTEPMAAPPADPVADVLSSPLGAVFVLAVLGSVVVLTLGLFARRRARHRI